MRFSKKVYLDGYMLNKTKQGIVTHNIQIYKRLINQNPAILFYLGTINQMQLQQELGIFPNLVYIQHKQKNRFLRMIFEIPKIIQEKQIDFAHFTYFIPFVLSEKCKYIVTIHDILFEKFKNQFSFIYRLSRNIVYKYSAKKADFVFTVSNYCKEDIATLYNIPKSKIYVTPNGIDSIYFETYNKIQAKEITHKKHNTSNFILYVSRIEPRKNHYFLLKSFIENKLYEEFCLVCIGTKSMYIPKLERLYNSLSDTIKQKIIFIDNISDDELVNFYKASDFFVYPSLAEGFGIPPLEAGAMKIPVLCSNSTAMKEFNFFGKFHVDCSSYKEFNSSFIQFIKNKHEQEKLENITTFIKKNYSWQKSVQVFNSVLEN
ncbi:MAG: glycosyltransferase family 4 protein [Flavobacteriales bacterium]|nr:glycosyltransferase family 4 protein [Flavobacteriales bacterium]